MRRSAPSGGLGTVIVVVVGVLTGWYTAAEAAAVACLWALIVSFVFYMEIRFKAIFDIFGAAVKNFASVLLLCAAAGTFGFVHFLSAYSKAGCGRVPYAYRQ